MPNPLILETERLHIRPVELADAAFILELMNMPKWIQNIGDRNVHSIEDAQNYMKEKMFPQYERLGYGNFTVIRKSDQAKIGTCGLYDREGLDGIDIGFAFLPDYEKQGYAFESSKCIFDAAIHQLGIKKIQGITIRENIASQKLLIKLGLKEEGVVNLPNDDVELLLYTFKVTSPL